MRQSLNHYVECEISSGYKFDDKKPDAPALRIQFAHFPFKLPDHDEQQNGVPRWLQGHQWMTITKRNIFFHSELCRWVVSAICTAFCWTRNSFSKKHQCHVGACEWLGFSWPFVMMLQVICDCYARYLTHFKMKNFGYSIIHFLRNSFGRGTCVIL